MNVMSSKRVPLNSKQSQGDDANNVDTYMLAHMFLASCILQRSCGSTADLYHAYTCSSVLRMMTRLANAALNLGRLAGILARFIRAPAAFPVTSDQSASHRMPSSTPTPPASTIFACARTMLVDRASRELAFLFIFHNHLKRRVHPKPRVKSFHT